MKKEREGTPGQKTAGNERPLPRKRGNSRIPFYASKHEPAGISGEKWNGKEGGRGKRSRGGRQACLRRKIKTTDLRQRGRRRRSFGILASGRGGLFWRKREGGRVEESLYLEQKEDRVLWKSKTRTARYCEESKAIAT